MLISLPDEALALCPRRNLEGEVEDENFLTSNFMPSRRGDRLRPAPSTPRCVGDWLEPKV